MEIRLTTTIITSKLLRRICRWLGTSGTSLPGKLALMMFPLILKKISDRFQTIIVTGTNGKTTTARIVGQILEENHVRYIANKSGANLLSGIANTFLEAVDYRGKSPVKVALIECDEAAFKTVADHVESDVIIVTNFFRDQLDRYGELYTTLKNVSTAIEKSEKTRLVLNSDDSLCASLGRTPHREVFYYGFGPDALQHTQAETDSDAAYCLDCKTKYNYTYHTYGHLGGFSCPGCGYARPDSSLTCSKVLKMTNSDTSIELQVSGSNEIYTGRVNIPGIYNVYNALAAAACGLALGFPINTIIDALSRFQCGFGRMETIQVSGRKIELILVKNPAGFNQVMQFLLTEQKNIQLAFAINDKFADSTDISWLWDVDFEKLQLIKEQIECIHACGTRKEDLIVRLKYAGVSADRIIMHHDYDSMIRAGLSRMEPGQNFYILPTYTAMLDIRKVLKKKFGLKEIWE